MTYEEIIYDLEGLIDKLKTKPPPRCTHWLIRHLASLSGAFIITADKGGNNSLTVCEGSSMDEVVCTIDLDTSVILIKMDIETFLDNYIKPINRKGITRFIRRKKES